jgi:hypothetical protein
MKAQNGRAWRTTYDDRQAGKIECNPDACLNANIIVTAGLGAPSAVFDLSVEAQVAMVIDARQRDVGEQDVQALTRLLGRYYARAARNGSGDPWVVSKLAQVMARASSSLTILVLADDEHAPGLARHLQQAIRPSCVTLQVGANR